MGVRRVAAIGAILGGALATVAPFVPWFRVEARAAGAVAIESLVGTSYGTFMTFLGLVAIGCGVAQLRRWESWDGWAAIAAVAMAFVMAAGLRGAIDPLGAAKEAVRPSSSVVATAGISVGRGYRERVHAAFDQGDLHASASAGGGVAAAGGALGIAASLPRLLRGRTHVGPRR